jgi:uncharacterized protein
MSQERVVPITPDERIEIIDVLRGLAVAGILIGNMQWFSGYGMVPPGIAEAAPLADRVVHYLVHFFIEGKFYSIFSFLFGFNFALQIARAEQRGDQGASVFKRRLFWLFVIGALHAFMLWAGDILSVYAVMGFILLLFRRKPERSLIKWAVALIIFPVVWYVLLWIVFLAFAPAEASSTIDASMAEGWRRNAELVSHGGYWDIFKGYNLMYVVGRWIGLVMQMRLPKILAMFLLGCYAYRKGFFQNINDHASFRRKVLLYGLILGVIGNVAMASFAANEAPFPPSIWTSIGVFGYAFGVPALALFFVALVATLWQSPFARRVLSIVAPVGRMALTNYLLQTAICITIFYGYGFEWFGQVGAVTATLIALAIFAAQIVLSTAWLNFFAYGPMEWVWRQLTYGRRLSLVRSDVKLADA